MTSEPALLWFSTQGFVLWGEWGSTYFININFKASNCSVSGFKWWWWRRSRVIPSLLVSWPLFSCRLSSLAAWRPQCPQVSLRHLYTCVWRSWRTTGVGIPRHYFSLSVHVINRRRTQQQLKKRIATFTRGRHFGVSPFVPESPVWGCRARNIHPSFQLGGKLFVKLTDYWQPQQEELSTHIHPEKEHNADHIILYMINHPSHGKQPRMKLMKNAQNAPFRRWGKLHHPSPQSWRTQTDSIKKASHILPDIKYQCLTQCFSLLFYFCVRRQKPLGPTINVVV